MTITFHNEIWLKARPLLIALIADALQCLALVATLRLVTFGIHLILGGEAVEKILTALHEVGAVATFALLVGFLLVDVVRLKAAEKV